MDVSHENRHTIAPTSKDLGNRIDTFLAQSKYFKDIVGRELSRTHIARGIRNGGAFFGLASAKPHTKIPKDISLTVLLDKFTRAEKTLTPEPDLPIIIIEETPDFLIINKPAGIQVHPSSTRDSGTVVHWSIAHYPEIAGVGDPARPGIVHRLDRDTSGLLIIARTKKTFTALKKRFKERTVHKRYFAMVYGVPKAKEGIIATPIARSTRGDRQSAALPGRRVKGIIRPAETVYKVLKTFKNAALIEAEPKTGRTHQIRVHLASIGHPVLGDMLYASRDSRAFTPLPARQLLHATSLSFELFGQPYSFTAPIPSDFSDWQGLFTKQQQ